MAALGASLAKPTPTGTANKAPSRGLSGASDGLPSSFTSPRSGVGALGDSLPPAPAHGAKPTEDDPLVSSFDDLDGAPRAAPPRLGYKDELDRCAARWACRIWRAQALGGAALLVDWAQQASPASAAAHACVARAGGRQSFAFYLHHQSLCASGVVCNALQALHMGPRDWQGQARHGAHAPSFLSPFRRDAPLVVDDDSHLALGISCSGPSCVVDSRTGCSGLGWLLCLNWLLCYTWLLSTQYVTLKPHLAGRARRDRPLHGRGVCMQAHG